MTKILKVGRNTASELSDGSIVDLITTVRTIFW